MRFSKINLALLFLSSDGKLRCSNSNASNVTGEPSLKAAGSHVSPFLSRSALDFREPLLLSRRGDYLWKSVEALSVPTDQCEGCPFLTVCMAPGFRLGLNLAELSLTCQSALCYKILLFLGILPQFHLATF